MQCANVLRPAPPVGTDVQLRLLIMAEGERFWWKKKSGWLITGDDLLYGNVNSGII